MRYLFSLLLLTLLPTLASATDVRFQSLTTGNNAWDSGQHLGLVAPTYLKFYNPGTVVVQVAFTQADATASQPAFQLSQGQAWTVNCASGCPTKAWFKGISAAGTVHVTASNKIIGVVQSELVSPEALASASRQTCRTMTIGFADFTAAALTEIEIDPAGAIPAGAIQANFELDVTVPLVGPSISAGTMECGYAGAGEVDVLTDAVDVLTAAVTDYGSGTNGKPWQARRIGGKTLQCKLTTVGANTTVATAFTATAKVCYTFPIAG